MKFLKNTFLCVAAGILLMLAFPRMGWWPLAWVSFVPLLYALGSARRRSAFFLGWIFGLVFFVLTLGWLVHVTMAGMLIMCMYLALYPACFAAACVHFRELPLVLRAFVLASVWAVLEFMRANLFTGFGWVTLGHSQYKNLILIQIADIIGVYGISFIVMLVNLFIYETIRFVLDRDQARLNSLRLLQMIIVTIVLAAVCYGVWTFQTAREQNKVTVAVVQPDIPQRIKWDEQYMPSIVMHTLNLSREAALEKPALIVWPETSLPGVLSEVPEYADQIKQNARALKTPFLIGAITQEKGAYYNSAILIGDEGDVRAQYRKIHLVPFGEFLPLRPVLGWLNKYIGLEDFTSGREYTLFPLPDAKNPFGVLICFEDAVYYLWRSFALNGAAWMVNITNDAWFMDTKEPFLHLQTAVFGSVMTKRSLVRAANTGVSGFIDPFGRIIDTAHDESGRTTFVSAHASAQIPLEKRITFYTKYADVFTYLCFVCILTGVFVRPSNRAAGEKDA